MWHLTKMLVGYCVAKPFCAIGFVYMWAKIGFFGGKASAESLGKACVKNYSKQ